MCFKPREVIPRPPKIMEDLLLHQDRLWLSIFSEDSTKIIQSLLANYINNFQRRKVTQELENKHAERRKKHTQTRITGCRNADHDRNMQISKKIQWGVIFLSFLLMLRTFLFPNIMVTRGWRSTKKHISAQLYVKSCCRMWAGLWGY